MTAREDVEKLIKRLWDFAHRNDTGVELKIWLLRASDAIEQLEKTRAEEYAIALELRRKLAADRDRMRKALEIIAGRRQCIDTLMSKVAIAEAALHPQKPATGDLTEFIDEVLDGVFGKPPQSLADRLRMKASIIVMGEKIEWGSEVELMREAADRIEELEAGR